MKLILKFTAFIKLFAFCFTVITVTACTRYTSKDLLNVEANPEIIYEGLSWIPTSDSGIVTMELPEFTKNLSAINILRVRVNRNGYEYRPASYYCSPDNPFWYTITHNRLELFWAGGDNYYEQEAIKVIITLKG